LLTAKSNPRCNLQYVWDKMYYISQLQSSPCIVIWSPCTCGLRNKEMHFRSKKCELPEHCVCHSATSNILSSHCRKLCWHPQLDTRKLV